MTTSPWKGTITWIQPFALVFLSLVAARSQTATLRATAKSAKSADSGILWVQPSDIASLNLYYGPGGEEHAPKSTTFTFQKEDLDGTNPKFVVRDDQGIKWKVKLGIEVKSETAATRLLWAAGYVADEDYYLKSIRIVELPSHLHRGGKMIADDGTIADVRLKREDKDERKEGIWKWKDDPFVGTREMNGLRVMMALLNNWDLKDVNNSVVSAKDGSGEIYYVKDVGASLGTNQLIRNLGKARGNLKAYQASKFIEKITPTTVTLATPGKPGFWLIVNPKAYFSRSKMQWIRRDIPRTDARWLGDILSSLTPDQIRDAFRASGFSDAEVEGFTQVVLGRITELRSL